MNCARHSSEQNVTVIQDGSEIYYEVKIKHLNIMKTSPCNVYPLTPHFHIIKLGFTGVYIIFLFLL